MIWQALGLAGAFLFVWAVCLHPIYVIVTKKE